MRKLMYPRAVLLSLLVLLSTVGLLVVFTQEREQTPMEYMPFPLIRRLPRRGGLSFFGKRGGLCCTGTRFSTGI